MREKRKARVRFRVRFKGRRERKKGAKLRN